MEKQKNFKSVADALDFCYIHDVRYFNIKATKVGVTLRYYDSNVKCFYCEICDELTPYEYEGADPFTCSHCNPVRVEVEKVER